MPRLAEAAPPRASAAVRLVTLAVIVVPSLGVAAAAVCGCGRVGLCLLLVMYALTGLGVTAGFHRLFAHRSFEARPWVKLALAALGSMAVQGPLLKWVALHRLHHRHSDTPEDPHTPHGHGEGVLGLLRGLWHSHAGWFFAPDPPGLAHCVKDLCADPVLRAADRLFPLWAALGLAAPAALGGAATLSWAGAWDGLLWGGLVRVFLVHHVTWSVNSACHLWGSRPYDSRDQSRDNAVFGVLALGEGWHNTHHAFPASARHGLRWWQPDASYWAIRALALLGLAWGLKLPTEEAQARARRPVMAGSPGTAGPGR